MKKFENKTLLVLGSSIGSVDIVNYAKENGAYTIVADYYPIDKSEAKQAADEALEISTGDIEKLSEFIRNRKIDGVFAGISEFNLLSAMSLAGRFQMPFYCTRQQWDMVEKKDLFRKLCEKYHVPCPKVYYTGGKMEKDDWDKIQFPAVIKPVDGSASTGVFICQDKKEMQKVEKDSLAASQCQTVIIEEFIEGKEFTAHYTISNGKAVLSTVDNRYSVAVNPGNVTTIPIARVYPSLFLEEFKNQVNGPMLDLCNSLKLKNAVLFIQGLYNEKKNTFSIFEAGLRIAGEAPYRFVEKVNGINNLYLLVDHALSVKSEEYSELEDPSMKGKCCGIISFVTMGGKVGNIIGLEEAVKATTSVISYENRYPVGTETPNGNTLHQLMIRFVMICENREQMASDIKYLNDNISVLDINGDNMVKKIEPNRIFAME